MHSVFKSEASDFDAKLSEYYKDSTPGVPQMDVNGHINKCMIHIQLPAER